jgi:hypothetical protein
MEVAWAVVSGSKLQGNVEASMEIDWVGVSGSKIEGNVETSMEVSCYVVSRAGHNRRQFDKSTTK